MNFKVSWENTGEWQDAMDKMLHNMDQATKAGTSDAGFLLETEAKAVLSLSTGPEPSAPGEPPALQTGTLRRSVKAEAVRGGAGVYSTRVGARTVYARIQELGGRAGKNHSAHLPPRPYLKPSIESSKEALGNAWRTKWRRVWSTGSGGSGGISRLFK